MAPMRMWVSIEAAMNVKHKKWEKEGRRLLKPERDVNDISTRTTT